MFTSQSLLSFFSLILGIGGRENFVLLTDVTWWMMRRNGYGVKRERGEIRKCYRFVTRVVTGM